MRPAYHPWAEAELYAATAFYAEKASGLGEEFLAEIFAVLRRIAQHPEAGAPYVENTRRLLVQRFPFSVVYRVEGDQVTIYAVMHHRQEPNYWRGRA